MKVRHQPYLVQQDVDGKLIIHNDENPCGQAPERENSEIQELKEIPYRPEFKRLCKVCSWGEKSEEKFKATPSKYEQK